MLNTTFPESKSEIEGYVLSVDGTRRICSVATINGRILKNVFWGLPQGGSGRAGIHTSPTRGDKVLVSTSLTYPVITQFLTSLSDGSEKPVEMMSSNPVPDLGNSSQIGSGEFMDPFAPIDSVPGDFTVTTEGGSTLANLRGGSILIKASALSEIFLSRINSLMRLVSRNWEHFTDGFVDVSRNMAGRVYRFTGYSDSAEDVRKDTYLHYEVSGDVAAGEAVKWAYNGFDIGSLPAQGTTVFKRATFDSSGTSLSYVSWDKDGSVVQKVSDTGGSNNSTLTQKNNEVSVTTVGGTTGTLSVKGDTISLDIAGQGNVTIKSSQIQVKVGSSTGTYSSNQIELTNGSHGVLISPTGVDLY